MIHLHGEGVYSLEMIGITFDTTAAQAYINTLSNLNITGVIFMQGDRIMNFISQGVTLNMVDRVISAPSKYAVCELDNVEYKAYAHEIVALGDGQSRTMFPHISPYSFSSIVLDEGDNTKKNIFTFPVNLIRWIERDGGVDPTTDHRNIAYVAPYFNKDTFVNDGLSSDGDSIHHTTQTERVFYSITLPVILRRIML